MIAEWVYPKELKEVIADLRAKGQLDYSAVERMNGYIYWRASVFFIVAILLVISGITFAQRSTIIASLFLFGVIGILLFHYRSEEMRILKLFPILYVKGKTTEGICLGLIKKRYPTTPYPKKILWELKYQFKVNLNNYVASTKNIPMGIVKPDYQKNDAVAVFYDPDNPERSVPYVPALYALFYLKK